MQKVSPSLLFGHLGLAWTCGATGGLKKKGRDEPPSFWWFFYGVLVVLWWLFYGVLVVFGLFFRFSMSFSMGFLCFFVWFQWFYLRAINNPYFCYEKSPEGVSIVGISLFQRSMTSLLASLSNAALSSKISISGPQKP